MYIHKHYCAPVHMCTEKLVVCQVCFAAAEALSSKKVRRGKERRGEESRAASVRRSCRRRSLPGAISVIGNRLQVPFVPSVVASLRHVHRRWSLPCAICALGHRVWAPFLPSVVACGRPCSPKQRLPSVNGETRAAGEHARDSEGAPSAVTTVEVG